MKGISIAIETIIYLILAITVLSVLLFFFLSQAGPSQDQFKLEADRSRYCGSYVSKDLTCAGKDGGPVSGLQPGLVEKIKKTCLELNRRFNFAYCQGDKARDLECIRDCCLTCPKQTV